MLSCVWACSSGKSASKHLPLTRKNECRPKSSLVLLARCCGALKRKADNVGCGVLRHKSGVLAGKREYVFSFIFKLVHEYIGKFSNVSKIFL